MSEERSREGERTATTYRYCDRVAVHLPGMRRPAYLLPVEAKHIARALNRAARDVAAVPFTSSDLGSIYVDLDCPALRDRTPTERASEA